MKTAYVLLCEMWTGTTYNTEVVCVYLDMEMAHRQAVSLQGKLKPCDIRYFVEEAEFEDFIP